MRKVWVENIFVKFGKNTPMSRIGKKPITIPAGVEISLSANMVTVRGVKGTLTFAHRPEVGVTLEENLVSVQKLGGTKLAQALW